MAWDELSDEQREIRDLVRTLARERIAPRAAEIDESHEFPWDVVELYRENDIFGLFHEEQYGGLGTGALLSLIAIEEISKVCATSGADPRRAGARLARAQARRQRRAEAALPAEARKRRVAVRVRAHRGRLRLGLGGDALDRTPRRQRVRPQRLEAVHHERERRQPLHGVREDRSRAGAPWHLGLRRRGGCARLRGDAARAEDGDQRLDNGRARVRRLPHSRGQPARRRGRGLRDSDAHPRPLAARCRRAGARDRAGRDRLRARVREDARDDGEADRAAPADPGEARRHGDGMRGRARAALHASGGWSTPASTVPS